MDKMNTFISAHVGENKYQDLRPGWTVRVHQKIKEGERTRTQAFEGIIISRKHGNEPGATITVRKVSGGIGVEKIFPLHLPTITKIEVMKKARVRRAKLYYLRDKSQREIRRKTRLEVAKPTVAPEPEAQ